MERFDAQQIIDAITQLTTKIDSLTLIKEPTQSPDLTALFTALAKAQGEFEIAGMRATNNYFKVKYEDLTELVKVSRPALTKYGLSVLQQIMPNDDGQNILRTKLGHSSGQWMESRMRIIPPKNDIQTLGSYLNCLKRFAYGSLIGVVAQGEDDDGEYAMAQAKEIIAKGSAMQPSYQPKKESYDVVSKEQLEELEYELKDYSDLAEEIMDKLRLQSLADLPKSQYMKSIEWIRKVKLIRNEGKQE